MVTMWPPAGTSASSMVVALFMPVAAWQGKVHAFTCMHAAQIQMQRMQSHVGAPAA